jgi:F-type H+-transporting ATPase subunit a
MNNNLIFTIASPLDQFEVTNLIGINAPILGYLNLSLTNLGLYSLIVLTLILSLHLLTINNNKIIPSK